MTCSVEIKREPRGSVIEVGRDAPGDELTRGEPRVRLAKSLGELWMTKPESIFIFARANPALLASVEDWLGAPEAHMTKVEHPLEVLHDSRPNRALIAVFEQVPGARDAQDLIDLGSRDVSVICLVGSELDSKQLGHLVEIGLHEVISLETTPNRRLSHHLSASLQRDRVRRELLKLNEQTLVRRDVSAALAVASSRHDVLSAFATGLVALGAEGASVWHRTERGVRETLSLGGSLDMDVFEELPLDALHPAPRGLSAAGPEWISEWPAALERLSEWRPPQALQSSLFAVLPIVREGRTDEVVLASFPSNTPELLRPVVEQLAVELAGTLLRTDLQSSLQTERDVLHRLLSVVSHDLRNPLSTVRLSSELLSGSSDPLARSVAEKIDRAARSGQSLVEDLLTFVGSATRGIELELVRGDLVPLTKSLVDEANVRASGGRVVVASTRVETAEVMMDPRRVEQAIGNLLSNALAYSPRDSRIELEVSMDEHAAYVDVENRGRSLDPEEIAQIFEPMKRLGAVGERGSVGLGLFIVDRVMDAHGGSVWVEPGEPDGVRFCLQLPRSSRDTTDLALVEAPRTGYLPASEGALLSEEDAKLIPRFRDEALATVLRAWAAARRDEPMPHPLSLDRARILSHLPDMAMATVGVGQDGEPCFEWKSIGPRLERRLRGTLSHQLGQDDPLRTQYDSYLACYRTRRPRYDFVRRRGAHPITFERLLLPLSRSRNGDPTDILTLALFREPNKVRP